MSEGTAAVLVYKEIYDKLMLDHSISVYKAMKWDDVTYYLIVGSKTLPEGYNGVMSVIIGEDDEISFKRDLDT